MPPHEVFVPGDYMHDLVDNLDVLMNKFSDKYPRLLDYSIFNVEELLDFFKSHMNHKCFRSLEFG